MNVGVRDGEAPERSAALPRRRVRGGPEAAVLLAACLVFAGSLGAGFAIDDESIIVGNPVIRKLADVPRVFRLAFWDRDITGQAHSYSDRVSKGSYRPLTIASFALNYALAGRLAGPPTCAHCREIGYSAAALRAVSYHLVNLLLHACVALLVLVLARRLGMAEPAATLAGLVFALHPVHVDAVAWVTQRGELLAAGLAVAAWICHLRGGRSRWAGPPLFFLALLGKETCLALPLLIVGGDYVLGRLPRWPGAPRSGPDTRREAPPPTAADAVSRAGGAGWGEYAALAATFALYLLVRHAVLGRLQVAHEIHYFAGAAPLVVLLTVCRFVVGEYAWGLLGGRIGTDYTRPAYADSSPGDPASWAAVAALALVIGCLLYALRRRSRPAAAVAATLAALAPLSHIVHIPLLGAARVLYFPSIGVSLLLGGLAARALTRGGRLGAAATAALLLAFGAATAQGVRGWTTESAAAERTLAATPDNPLALANRAGQLAAARRFAAARPLIEHALRVQPDLPLLWYNYATLLMDLGQPGAALAAVDRGQALDVDPPVAAHAIRARLFLAAHDPAGARREIDAALALAPRAASVLELLGEWELTAGNPDAAVAALDRALPWCEENAGLELALGVALRRAGRREPAGSHLRRATELAPDTERVWSAWGLWLEQGNQMIEAEAAYRRAIALRDDWPEGHQNLGVLLRKLGRREEAVREYRRALALQPDLAEAHAELAGLLERDAPRAALAHWEAFLAAAAVRPELARMLPQVQRRVESLRERVAAEPTQGGGS